MRARTRRLALEALEDRSQPAPLSSGLAGLPLSFEANQGQFDSAIDFISRGPGYSLALADGDATLHLDGPDDQSAVLRMSLVGASAHPAIAAVNPLPGKVNYLVGDPSAWTTDVPTYGAVEYRDVYPGTDVIYYGNPQQLEFDFRLAPGADPSRIALAFDGADGMHLDADGNLVLRTAVGDVVEHAPVVYQVIGGQRRSVASRFDVRGDGTVGFNLGRYDRSRELVIDPVLSYVSYFGGDNSDAINSVAIDPAGNIYLAGRTDSSAIPPGSSPNPTFGRGFVAKMNPSATALLYITYLATDQVTGVAVDATGSAYIVGDVGGVPGFATTGAAQTTYGGNGDAYVAKLTPAGNAFAYRTFIGGNQLEEGRAIAVDRNGNAFVTGFTTSPNFPTRNALQGSLHAGSGLDAFVTKVNPTGTQFLFSTYLGGSENGGGEGGATTSEGNAIALDGAGNPYVTGSTNAADFVTVNPFQAQKGYAQDVFVTGLKADGSEVLYSTFLSGPGQTVGSGNDEDIGYAIAVDRGGNIVVAGSTTSENFPNKNAFVKVLGNGSPSLRDPFATKLNPARTGAGQLVYSTYLGGSAIDEAFSVAIDGAGNAYVGGATNSHLNFPLVRPFQKTIFSDGFLAKFAPSGKVLMNSYNAVGAGPVSAIAISPFGSVVFAGNTGSGSMRTTDDAFQPDFPGATDSGFIAMLGQANKAAAGTDIDGGTWSVKLSGPGAVSVRIDDPDGDGQGPIQAIHLQGTTARSSLRIGARAGDGFVDVGSIGGSGIGRISAAKANLIGSGINLAGPLGALVIHDLKNGADVIAAGPADGSTALSAHEIGDGTTISVGGSLSRLLAARVHGAVVQAVNLRTLKVTGDRRAGLAGDFAAAVTLTGTDRALGSARVAGTFTGTITANVGDVGSFAGTRMAGGILTADRIGRVTLKSVLADNGNVKYGVRAHTSVRSVRVGEPSFEYEADGPATQKAGDFEVTVG